jgi:hypothetical protein
VKKVILILLLIVAAYLLWRWWNSGRDDAAAADRGQDLVFDRLWVDHMPQSETDTFQLFAAVTEQPIGVFQQTSVWKGSFEMFRYQDKGDGQIVITYPQSKDNERASYRARRCSERGFDYCLELGGNSRGTKRYYSQKGWEIGGAHDALSIEADAARLLQLHP